MTLQLFLNISPHHYRREFSSQEALSIDNLAELEFSLPTIRTLDKCIQNRLQIYFKKLSQGSSTENKTKSSNTLYVNVVTSALGCRSCAGIFGYSPIRSRLDGDMDYKVSKGFNRSCRSYSFDCVEIWQSKYKFWNDERNGFADVLERVSTIQLMINSSNPNSQASHTHSRMMDIMKCHIIGRYQTVCFLDAMTFDRI